MRSSSHHKAITLVCYLKCEPFTCAGVVIVTVAGVAGAGALGVETAEG